VVEGTNGVAEALAASAPIEAVYAGPDADRSVVERAASSGIPVHELAAGVIERVADAVTPQPVAAVVKFIDVQLNALSAATFVLVCVAVRDPGNAGTALRSAEAAGADGVLFTDGSVDVYNPKTVRASAGSVFHVPIVAGGDPVNITRQLQAWGLTTVAATARGGDDPSALDLTKPVAVLVGNETHGLTPELANTADVRATIPMRGRSESLNVGMAGTVLAFEVARQRRERVDP
jgi:TrmH family RNA methyltransferase